MWGRRPDRDPQGHRPPGRQVPTGEGGTRGKERGGSYGIGDGGKKEEEKKDGSYGIGSGGRKEVRNGWGGSYCL